jgi:hypothetical protein
MKICKRTKALPVCQSLENIYQGIGITGNENKNGRAKKGRRWKGSENERKIYDQASISES